MKGGEKTMTKKYIFTKFELYALREALDFYYHNFVKLHKITNQQSSIAMETYKQVKPLLDQFKDDICLGKEGRWTACQIQQKPKFAKFAELLQLITSLIHAQVNIYVIFVTIAEKTWQMKTLT